MIRFRLSTSVRTALVFPTIAVAAISAAMLAAVPAGAVTTFTASLSSLNEVPIVESPGGGLGTLTLATDQNSFTILETYRNLSSNAVGAHVHCCSRPGANAPIAINFMVPGGLSGTITGTFDLTQATTYTAGFLNANGGTAVSARTAFLTGLNGGLAYLNIHTQSNPGGEIRGQLAQAVGNVPEPATWAMMIAGFGMVGGAARHRQRRAVTA